MVLVLSSGAAWGGTDTCRTYSSGARLPIIVDCTVATPRPRVRRLVRRAVEGLGFPLREGPRREDLVFVGSHYMAWIDRTGFSGKMNGLWPLNGSNANLDFVLVEPTLAGTLRPINLLLPGEDGDGQWPAAYNGGEHYEIPRYQSGRHTAQAGLREANHFTNPALETWRQCINSDHAPERWDRSVGVNSLRLRTDGAVEVKARAPLKIVARFSAGAYACGTAFPFNNEQPGRMEIATGYVFHPREHGIERTYQLYNHAPHTYQPQSPVDKLIGGLLLTDWPHPHYLKQFQRWGRWDAPDLSRDAAFPYLGTGQVGDYIEVHGTGTRGLSAAPTRLAGRSIGVEQSDPGGVGLCLCRAHGGVELGGAVLANLTLPGTLAPAHPMVGPVHRRRFLLGDAGGAGSIVSHRLQAEEPDPVLHEVGLADGTAWSAAASATLPPGFLYYRKYLPIEKGATGQAAFTLGIDSVDALDVPVVTVDLVHNARDVIASRDLLRSAFRANRQPQRFVLDFQSPGDGVIEPRVRWHNRAGTRLDGIVLNWIPPEKEVHRLEAAAPVAQHHTGKQEGTFWGADVHAHAPGLLYFGPRVRVHRSTAVEARFHLSIDVVAGPGVDPQSKMATLDLLVHKDDASSYVAASRTLNRNDFAAPDGLQSFSIAISLAEPSWVEPRVYYHRSAYTRLEHVLLRVIHF
jgi:hypothetical protein